MHQHGHMVVRREFIDALHPRRIAFDAEFLLGNRHSTLLCKYLSITSVMQSAKSGTSLAANA